MKVYYTKGKNNVSLELTALKFENKLNSVLNYDKKEFKTIKERFRRKGEKIRSIVITYSFGYKSKKPYMKSFRTKVPIDYEVSDLDKILEFTGVDMQEKYYNYLEYEYDESIPYYLRAVDFYFISDKEKLEFHENISKENKKTKSTRKKSKSKKGIR